MDVVTLPGQNWCCTRSGGYLPRLRDKRAILVYTSANNYCSDRVGQGVQLEFQKPFMRKWLGFIGVEVIGAIVVAPTLTDPDSLGGVLVRAKREARPLALSTYRSTRDRHEEQTRGKRNHRRRPTHGSASIPGHAA